MTDDQGSRWYLAAVLALPLVLLWRQDNILFTGNGFLHPWLFFGYFRDLVEFKRELIPGNTLGTYLSWILPGAAMYRLFPPVAANCYLHLGVQAVAGVSLFVTLRWMVGARRAFAVTLLFSLNPWVWAAAGWDYVDGAGIAWYLLTMALLTGAAAAPVRRGRLVAAGLTLAAMVYANPDWIPLAPLPPLYYAALARMWRGIPLRRSVGALCGWLGAGCLLVTVVLCAINYGLDGHFWFYASPVLAVFRRGTSGEPWWQGLWRDGAPSPWLLPAIAGGAASVSILVREVRGAVRKMTVSGLFAWQFLAALGWLTVCQMRGNPMLSTPYRANVLLAFGFLAIGVRIWPELETARPRMYLWFCGAAALSLGYAWSDDGVRYALSLPYAAWTGIAAVAALLAWRRFPENLLCGLGGFWIFTALGVSVCFAGVDPHAFRDQFQALCRARDRIEAVRQGKPVRFWWDKGNSGAESDEIALISTYSWDDALLNQSMPSQSFDEAPCGRVQPEATLIAALGREMANGADVLAGRLTACWSGKGLRVSAVESDTVERRGARYELYLMWVERAP